MLQGKCVFFARFTKKPFKDEYKTFLLIIILNFIISFLDYAYNYEEKFYTGGEGYFLVVGSNGYVPLDGVAFSGLTIVGLHFYKGY